MWNTGFIIISTEFKTSTSKSALQVDISPHFINIQHN